MTSRLYKLIGALILTSILIYSTDISRWRRRGGDDDDDILKGVLPVDRASVELKPLSKDSIQLDARIFQGDPSITYKMVGGGRKRRKAKRRKVDDLVPKVKVDAVNCGLLFRGDTYEHIKAERYHFNLPSQPISQITHMVQQLQDSDGESCKSLLRTRHYIDEALNEAEANFPVAYSMLVYKDFDQFERLLRTIYRPQNFYCVHVDSKSDPHFRTLVRKLASCFAGGRVFMAPRSFDVQWAKFTVLQAEVLCMEELWRRFAVEEVQVTITPRRRHGNTPPVTKVTKKRPRWKYFINLTGQEFPLRTNWELVQILKVMDGANNVEGTTKRMNKLLKDYYYENKPFRGLIIHKGSVHVVLSRAFVDYTLHHPLPSSLLTSLRYAYIPDEYFFSTLNYNPLFRIPGSYTGKVSETDPVHNRFLSRFKNWGYKPFAWPCQGRWVRQICNFGVGDLPLLSSRDELFANKFDSTYEPLAYDCMEEALFAKIRKEYQTEYGEVKKSPQPRDIPPLTTPFTPLLTTTPTPLPPNPNMTNPDHKLFPSVPFSSFGDVLDGTFREGEGAGKLSNYLHFVRPSSHEPLYVEQHHYHNLSFIKDHYRVDENWVYLFDEGFELTVNDKYNQSVDSYVFEGYSDSRGGTYPEGDSNSGGGVTKGVGSR